LAWARNGTPDTRTTQGTDLDITDMTAKLFNQIIIHTVGTGSFGGYVHFNDDTANNYAYRFSTDGAADSTAVNIGLLNTVIQDNAQFIIVNAFSVANEEKLVSLQLIDSNNAGAANAPFREELAGKYVPSPDADITGTDCDDIFGGNFVAGANISALGTD